MVSGLNARDKIGQQTVFYTYEKKTCKGNINFWGLRCTPNRIGTQPTDIIWSKRFLMFFILTLFSEGFLSNMG